MRIEDTEQQHVQSEAKLESNLSAEVNLKPQPTLTKDPILLQNAELKHPPTKTPLNPKLPEVQAEPQPALVTESSAPFQNPEPELALSQSIKPQTKLTVESKIEPVETIQHSPPPIPDRSKVVAKASVPNDIDDIDKKCIERWRRSAWYSINQNNLLEESTEDSRKKNQEQLEQKIRLACKKDNPKP